MEPRTPFLDKNFVKYYHSITPELKKFEPYLKDQGNKALAKELNEKFQHWNWEQLHIVTKNKMFGLGEYMDAAAIDQEDGLIECEENDVVLKYEDETIDLRLLKIAFLKKKPHQETIKIDMSESILGVVEYIEKDKKLVINKDGRIYKE